MADGSTDVYEGIAGKQVIVVDEDEIVSGCVTHTYVDLRMSPGMTASIVREPGKTFALYKLAYFFQREGMSIPDNNDLISFPQLGTEGVEKSRKEATVRCRDDDAQAIAFRHWSMFCSMSLC